jgi:hypothetical protein
MSLIGSVQLNETAGRAVRNAAWGGPLFFCFAFPRRDFRPSDAIALE